MTDIENKKVLPNYGASSQMSSTNAGMLAKTGLLKSPLNSGSGGPMSVHSG
jgi:hypothetical protein